MSIGINSFFVALWAVTVVITIAITLYKVVASRRNNNSLDWKFIAWSWLPFILFVATGVLSGVIPQLSWLYAADVVIGLFFLAQRIRIIFKEVRYGAGV